jgi:two-component system chemotaxis response regulator CheB
MAAAAPNTGATQGSYPGAIGIVASAGGIPALIELLGLLRRAFPLPIFVAQHLPRAYSNLDLILSRRCSLRVRWAQDGPCDDMIGVTLAVPGTGIRITPTGIEIDRLAPLSNSWLPSGDRMIQSLVSIFGGRTVAIILSGMLPAGVEGIRMVRADGGITMAQNRASASDFEMPSAAIDFGKAEIMAPPWRMAEMLNLLAEEWCTTVGTKGAADGSPIASAHRRR